MNSERERLLGDVLAEHDESGALRDALLDRTLLQVKRRRTVRRLQRAGPILLVLPALALLLWGVYLPQGNGKAPYVLVRTEPLPRSALLETQPLAPSAFVASTPSPTLVTLTTRPQHRDYREIDDDALLALAGTNAAVLVRSGPHSAQLLFASGTMPDRVPQ